MKTKKILLSLLFLALLSVVGFFAYSAWSEYKVVESQNAGLSPLQIAENKKRIHDAFIALPQIREKDLLQGFWYVYTDEYGNEHVLYFDPEYLATKGLSDEELKILYDKLLKSKVSAPKSMRSVPESELPPELQFHNKVYSFGNNGKTEEMLRELEKRLNEGVYTAEDLFEIAYLYELEGRYKECDIIYEKSCTEFQRRCSDELVQSVVQGRVVDSSGVPVTGAKIDVLSKDSIKPVFTDLNGQYAIDVPVRKLQKVRLHATKKDYSDGMADFIVVTEKKQRYIVDDIILDKAAIIVSVDTVKKTATGDVSELRENDFIVKTSESEWKIPFDSIVHKNGKKYQGTLKVYIYEWLGDSAPLSFLRIDTFGAGTGFLSDGMKSFGMPYIQFVSDSGEELHIMSSNPIGLSYVMVVFSPEYRATAERPLTDTDIQLLLSASDKHGYPITYELLQKLGMVYVPPFWALDRVRGVWNNIGFKLINKEGLIKTQFYTMKTLR